MKPVRDRLGVGWTSFMRQAGNPSTPLLASRAIVQPLRGVGLQVEPLSDTWARFFPGVPAAERNQFAYPKPLTDSLWKLYSEPLTDFVSPARALEELLSAVQMQEDRKLRQTQRPAPAGMDQAAPNPSLRMIVN